MKIQFLGSHTITLPVIQASSTQKTRNAMKDLATNTRDKPSRSYREGTVDEDEEGLGIG
jgi:hypothetical protein